MTKQISHSYYVVMEDLGQRGFEAIVTPETTRRAVVAFLKGGNYRNVVFIHHIDGLNISDVTEELQAEAGILSDDYRTTLTGEDKAAWDADRALALMMAE